MSEEIKNNRQPKFKIGDHVRWSGQDPADGIVISFHEDKWYNEFNGFCYHLDVKNNEDTYTSCHESYLTLIVEENNEDKIVMKRELPNFEFTPPAPIGDYSKVMSPEEWFNKKYPHKEYSHFYSIDADPQYEGEDMVQYSEYVSQHSSSGIVWRKASEGFPVEGDFLSLKKYSCRSRIGDKRPLIPIDYSEKMILSMDGTGKCWYREEDIEYLDESASRPEIKLPEKIVEDHTKGGYEICATNAWNNCIEEIKRLNWIK